MKLAEIKTNEIEANWPNKTPMYAVVEVASNLIFATFHYQVDALAWVVGRNYEDNKPYKVMKVIDP